MEVIWYKLEAHDNINEAWLSADELSKISNVSTDSYQEKPI